MGDSSPLIAAMGNDLIFAGAILTAGAAFMAAPVAIPYHLLKTGKKSISVRKPVVQDNEKSTRTAA